MSERVTVIVPTYQDEHLLPRILTPLKIWQQKDPKKRLLAVVDDNPPGASEKPHVARIAKRMHVAVVDSYKEAPNHSGKSRALVAGVKFANKTKSEFIITLDVDLRNVQPKQLDTLIKEIKAKKCDMLIAPAREPEGLLKYTSGQRIFRTEAFKPLIMNNQKWIDMLQGNVPEAALNRLIKKRKFSNIVFEAESAYRGGRGRYHILAQAEDIGRVFAAIEKHKRLERVRKHEKWITKFVKLHKMK